MDALLVAIWALSGRGYFWPGWVIVGWGVGLAMHAISVLGPRATITEEEIRREGRRWGVTFNSRALQPHLSRHSGNNVVLAGVDQRVLQRVLV